VAGGRSLAPPPRTKTLQARSVTVRKHRGRPLPVHADGESAGITPVTLDIAPAALRVIVGPLEGSGICAWQVVGGA
jgi:diacylglycerol kinase family enzyme